MSKFEDRLWSELVCDYGPELASQRRVELPARSRPRAPMVAVAVALLGALVAVVLATTTGTSTSEAYVVSQSSDGTVTVSINELTGISGANAQLASLGVKVRVAAVEPDCSQVGQIVRIPPALAPDLAVLSGQGVTIQPNLIPQEDTLVLSARQVGQAVALSYGLYQDPPPTCVKAGDGHAG